MNTMENEDGEWCTAYTMSAVQDKMFFVIIEKGISAMITNGSNLKLGNFYEVKYAVNSSALPQNRAQHLITQYRPIAPLAAAVVDTDEVGRQHVTLTTTAEIIGTVRSNGHYVINLYNDTFGYFIDVKNIVKKRDQNKMVEFEFKCMASQMDKYKSVFVPMRVLNYYDMPVELSLLAGVICTEPNGASYLWSKDLDRVVYLNDDNLPQNRDLRAYWVEAKVDKARNCVVGEVEKIGDLLVTRLCEGVTEILATFCNRGFSDEKQCRTYKHDHFPCIFDSRHKVQHIEEDVLYTGWIQHQTSRGNNDFWFISLRQPLIIAEYSNGVGRVERPESRASDRTPYHNEGLMNNEPRNYSSSHNGRQHFEQRRQPGSSFDNRQEISRTSSRAQTSSDDESEPENNTRREVTSALSDVAPGRRRNAGSSRSNDNNALYREIDSGSDDEYNNDGEQYRPNLNSPRGPVVGNITPLNDSLNLSCSNYATPMSQNGTPDRSASTSSDSKTRAVMQENNRLRLMVKKYAATVKYFTNEKLVNKEMMFYDKKQCEVMEKLESQASSIAPWLSKLNHGVNATEDENRVLVRRLEKLLKVVNSWLDEGVIRNAMRKYDASEFEELLECVSPPGRESVTLKQERDALKLKFTKCALLIEYFTEDADVSNVMIKYNRTKYEDLLKRVKDIYAKL